MFRRVWKAVETEARKIGTAKTKERREKRGRRKERKKQEKRELKKEREKKNQKKKNNRSEEGSRRMGDLGRKRRSSKVRGESKKAGSMSKFISLARKPVKECLLENYKITLLKQKKDLYQEREKYTYFWERRERICESSFKNN